MKLSNHKLGWMKDYPDIRDFGPETTTVQNHPLKSASKVSIKELLKRMGMDKLTAKDLKKKVDNRKWCSPVKDQGGIGACTAFAAVGMYEYFQNRLYGKYLSLIHI